MSKEALLNLMLLRQIWKSLQKIRRHCPECRSVPSLASQVSFCSNSYQDLPLYISPSLNFFCITHLLFSDRSVSSFRLSKPRTMISFNNVSQPFLLLTPHRVVAADGHTYERYAIARWFQTSNKSPLTGAVMSHANLVPNYMLLSSIASKK